jgi:hypothetical protein
VVFTEPEALVTVKDVFIGVFPAVTGHLIWDANVPITNAGSGCTETSPGSGFWNCGSADFRILLGGGSDQFHASAGASHTAAVSAITVFGGGGNDGITGGDGNDLFDGGAGADSMIGGAGIDQVTYAGRTGGVTVNLGQSGADDGSADDGALGARDMLDTGNIEGVIGAPAPMTGAAVPDRISLTAAPATTRSTRSEEPTRFSAETASTTSRRATVSPTASTAAPAKTRRQRTRGTRA